MKWSQWKNLTSSAKAELLERLQRSVGSQAQARLTPRKQAQNPKQKIKALAATIVTNPSEKVKEQKKCKSFAS